jgi:hypothetical protein
MRVRSGSMTVIAVALCLCGHVASASTIHVPADQPTIQAGIDAAVNGDTVLVSPGTYTGDGNSNMDFHGKGIAVVGNRGSGDSSVAVQSTERAFYFHSGESNSAAVVGLTIANVYSWGLRGSVDCDSGSSPTITSCEFINNFSYDCGAAVVVRGGSRPVVRNCIFKYNIGMHTSRGITGTVACFDASVVFEDCLFEENHAQFGGAVGVVNGSVIARRCRFVGNLAQQYNFEFMLGGDGGAFCLRGAIGEFDECLFLDNKAPLGWDLDTVIGGTGGVVALKASDCSFRNCTFVGNFTSKFTGARAGAFYADSSNMTLENCIVAFNNSFSTTFVDGSGASTFTLTNSDVYGNVGGDWAGGISGQFGVNGNISANPLFCDTTSNNFHLTYSSPCWMTTTQPPYTLGAYPVGCCQCETVGNVDCDAEGVVDIVDLVTLINKLYVDLSPMCCDAQADIDGTPRIDISDLTMMIDHLYVSFAPLRSCQ